MTIISPEKISLTTDKQLDTFVYEFMKEKRLPETSIRGPLNRAMLFEKRFAKPFYLFSFEEAMTMFKDVNSISVRSLQNMNLVLKNASYYFIQGTGLRQSSVYEDISKFHLADCINTNKSKTLTISKQELDDICNCLLNLTDRAILSLMFAGAGSKQLVEIAFFSPSQIDEKRNCVDLCTGKTIPISDDVCDLLKHACNETELYSFTENLVISKVRSFGLYKMRYNARSDNSDPYDEGDIERRYRFIQRRLALISRYLEIPLTPCALQASGLLWHLREEMEKEKLTFRQFVKTYSARALAYRYDILSEYAPQILVDKFGKYFPGV